MSWWTKARPRAGLERGLPRAWPSSTTSAMIHLQPECSGARTSVEDASRANLMRISAPTLLCYRYNALRTYRLLGRKKNVRSENNMAARRNVRSENKTLENKHVRSERKKRSETNTSAQNKLVSTL